MDLSTAGFPVLHHLPEFAQTLTRLLCPRDFFQTRIWKWVAFFSRGSSWSRDQTYLSCIGLYPWDTRETPPPPFFFLLGCYNSCSKVLVCEFQHLSLLVQFSLVTQSCPTLSDPMDCSTPGFPVHHQIPELAQTHVHRVSDAIQPSHLLSSSSLPAFNHSQHQGLFQWVSSSHQVARESSWGLYCFFLFCPNFFCFFACVVIFYRVLRVLGGML